MDFGFNFMSRGPLATPEAMAVMAKRGEELGFAYMTVNDHVIVPGDINSRYPYTETGAWGGGDTGACMEQITALGFLAALTSKIRLLTSVMVIPHRNPVLAAKGLATVDVLSGGRLTLGVGVGWMREEFEALDAPPFDERGAVSDEYIAAFKELWTSDDPKMDGKYVRFSNVKFEPKPVQKPHPPIWIGGESPPAMRRAAALGDGWYPVARNPRHPLDTVDRFGAAVSRVRQMTEEAGREPDSLDVAYLMITVPEFTPQEAADGGRRLFTGPAETIVDDIGHFTDLGMNHLITSFQTTDLNETTDRMAAFAEKVMAKVD